MLGALSERLCADAPRGVRGRPHPRGDVGPDRRKLGGTPLVRPNPDPNPNPNPNPGPLTPTRTRTLTLAPLGPQ